ncbi:hypothetical protein RYX36_000916 [Vicia faba]
MNFGDKFGVDDTIVCCIDLETKPLASIGFSMNGKWLGTAFQFDVASLGLGADSSLSKVSPWEWPLFPMAANYVLPNSRDFSYSDEDFDQVQFVELSRDTSQKYLDQDTPSLSNNNLSTLSHIGSSRSSSGSALQNQGSSTGFYLLAVAFRFYCIIIFNNLDVNELLLRKWHSPVESSFSHTSNRL